MQYIDHYGETGFNGEAVQQWLNQNVDYAIYISGLYLAFVFKGPDVVAAIHPPTKTSTAIVKKCWVMWNILLSVFSLYGSIRITPTLIHDFKTLGMRETLCQRRPEELTSGRVGLAIALFALSKLPEFGDTFFLILQGKKSLPFLQWFHHVTIFLYCWLAYQENSSILIVIASMNYVVHTIMYFYFAMAEAGYKSVVKPFAMYITIMQIAQMIGGLFMTGSFMMFKMQDGDACPGSTLALARGQMVVYLFNFYLFSKMFLDTYVSTPRPPSTTTRD